MILYLQILKMLLNQYFVQKFQTKMEFTVSTVEHLMAAFFGEGNR